MTLRDKIANEISKGAPIKNVFEIADAIMDLPEIADLEARMAAMEDALNLIGERYGPRLEAKP
jgi:hypothetical protein